MNIHEYQSKELLRRYGVAVLDGHVAWRNDLWDEKQKNPRMPKRGDLTWFPYPY